MDLRIVDTARRVIPGLNQKLPSRAKVYRERGGAPILEEVGAIRMRYDDLPDMHQLETGEETRAVDLEAIIQGYESDHPDDAVYIIECPKVGKDLVLRGVYDHGEIQDMPRYGGDPVIHFYEAESGQLVNWMPKFIDSDQVSGDIHEKARNLWQNYADGKLDEEPDLPKPHKIGITQYLIDDRDQRLTAWMDHLKRKFQKYEGGEGFWTEHFEIAVILAVAFSVAIIYLAVFGSDIGKLLPYVQTLAEHAPSMADAAESIASSPSGGGGGSVPGS